MPRPHIEPYDERPAPFKRMTLPGFGKGMHYKMLSMDTDTGACSLLVKFESGYKLPPGMSYSELEMFVVTTLSLLNSAESIVVELDAQHRDVF